MYQSIRILQLVCPIYRAPRHPLHDKRNIYDHGWKYQKGEFEGKFFLQPGFPPNGITTVWDIFRPFDSILCPYVKYSKSYFQYEIWSTFGTRHSLHSSFLKRPFSLSWIGTYFLLVILGICPRLYNIWKLFKMHMTEY